MRDHVPHILNNFRIIDGVLHRWYPSGKIKPVITVVTGRVAASLDGRRYFGPDIAWICHHLFACPVPVVTVDMNPHNLSAENVLPVKGERLVFRSTKNRQGQFRHPLDPGTFYSSRELAFAAWLPLARAHYNQDMDYIRSLGPDQWVLDQVRSAQQKAYAAHSVNADASASLQTP